MNELDMAYTIDIKSACAGLFKYLETRKLSTKEKGVVLSLCLSQLLSEHYDESEFEFMLGVIKIFYAKNKQERKDGN